MAPAKLDESTSIEKEILKHDEDHDSNDGKQHCNCHQWKCDVCSANNESGKGCEQCKSKNMVRPSNFAKLKWEKKVPD